VYTFTSSKLAEVGVYLLVENINSDYFEVKLTGPDQYDRLIIHVEGYTAHQDNPHLEENLLPGQYYFILTSQPSPGVLSIYTRGIP